MKVNPSFFVTCFIADLHLYITEVWGQWPQLSPVHHGRVEEEDREGGAGKKGHGRREEKMKRKLIKV